MVGDLRYGRTVHSLTKLLLSYPVEFAFVSPRYFADARRTCWTPCARRGTPFAKSRTCRRWSTEADVLYVTRVQKERFTDLADYDRVKDQYVVDPALMAQAKQRMIVMHPLPRVNEISYAVDDDPRAAYFRQMRNGMYIRMALLASVLGKA